jgi:hypothetical protein
MLLLRREFSASILSQAVAVSMGLTDFEFLSPCAHLPSEGRNKDTMKNPPNRKCNKEEIGEFFMAVLD